MEDGYKKALAIELYSAGLIIDPESRSPIRDVSDGLFALQISGHHLCQISDFTSWGNQLLVM